MDIWSRETGEQPTNQSRGLRIKKFIGLGIGVVAFGSLAGVGVANYIDNSNILYSEGSLINGVEVGNQSVESAVNLMMSKLGEVDVVFYDNTLETDISRFKVKEISNYDEEFKNTLKETIPQPKKSILSLIGFSDPTIADVGFKIKVDSNRLIQNFRDSKDFKELNSSLRDVEDSKVEYKDGRVVLKKVLSTKFDFEKLENTLGALKTLTFSQSFQEKPAQIKVTVGDNVHIQPNTILTLEQRGLIEKSLDSFSDNLGTLSISITDDVVKTVDKIDLLDNNVDDFVEECFSTQPAEIDPPKLKVSEEKIDEFIEGIKSQYNTLGSTRKFKTHDGRTIDITTGDYGWWLDYNKTYKSLLDAIGNNTNNITVSWRQKGHKLIDKQGNDDYNLSSTIDDYNHQTYLEVSIQEQKVYGYKDGELVYTSDCVTGSRGRDTPTGMFSIAYCQRDATLRGPGYATPVDYWMPFYNGCGFHDATWNGSNYGNPTYYIRHGSHGCVNLPYEKAKELFNLAEKGMMVVVY